MENLHLTTSTLPAANGNSTETDTPADAAAAESLLPVFSTLLVQQIDRLNPMPAAHGDPAETAESIVTGAGPARLTADPAVSPFPAFALPPLTPSPLARTSLPVNPAVREPPMEITRAATAVAAEADLIPEPAPVHGHETPVIAARAAPDVIGHGGNAPRLAERLLESISANHRDTAGPPVPQPAIVHAPPAPSPAAATTAAMQTQINTAIGTAGWNTELGQNIVWMIGAKQQVAELRVNPPDLGPLNIKLTMDDQQTTAVFTSPHSAVREAVEAALPRLREVLAQSGIMLGNASVTADSPRDGPAYGQQRQPAPTVATEAVTDPLSRRTEHVTTLRARGSGLVDLFA